MQRRDLELVCNVLKNDLADLLADHFRLLAVEAFADALEKAGGNFDRALFFKRCGIPPEKSK